MLRKLAIAVLVAFVAIACSGESEEADEVGGTCKLRPGVDCSGQDLRDVSMVSADLRGANFAGADLRGSDLRETNLTGANMVGAFLGGVNFTDATLVNVDFSRANFFLTNFSGANLTGANQTGVYRCNVTQPNGALITGDCAVAPGQAVATTGKKAPTGPPSIQFFRLEPPERCLNDAAGIGVYVEWATTNTTALSFAIDGVRIESAIKAKGRTRVPFVCDGKPHTVALQAFGPVAPFSATSSFSATLNSTDPESAEG